MWAVILDTIVDKSKHFYHLRSILTTTQHNNTTLLNRSTVDDKSNNHNNTYYIIKYNVDIILFSQPRYSNSKSLRYETMQCSAYNIQRAFRLQISKKFRYFTIKII